MAVAVPPASARVPVPNTVAPSMNVTVPVGSTAPAFGPTVAVNVTGWPNVLGSGGAAAVMVVVVAAPAIVMLNALVSTVPSVDAPSVFVARITIPEKVPAAVGVPVSAPVDARFNPFGSAFSITIAGALSESSLRQKKLYTASGTTDIIFATASRE